MKRFDHGMLAHDQSEIEGGRVSTRLESRVSAQVHASHAIDFVQICERAFRALTEERQQFWGSCAGDTSTIAMIAPRVGMLLSVASAAIRLRDVVRTPTAFTCLSELFAVIVLVADRVGEADFIRGTISIVLDRFDQSLGTAVVWL